MRGRVLLLAAALIATTPGWATADGEESAKPEEPPGPEIHLGAELVTTYTLEVDRAASRFAGGAFALNRFGVNADGSYRRLSFRARYVWHPYGDFIRFGYVAYQLAPGLEVQAGIPIQPFGVTSGLTSGFIYGLAYLLGMEDDADTGVTLALTAGLLDVRAAYFASDELAGSSTLRWGADIVNVDLDGDGELDGVGSEGNQGNLRVSAHLAHPLGSSELGVSGRVGRQVDGATERSARHAAAAAHVDSAVGNAHLKALFAVFDHGRETDEGGRPPAPYGAIGAAYAVAGRGQLLQANLSWIQPAALGPFDRVSLYNDFGAVWKDVPGSRATLTDIAGLGLSGRWVFVYAELLLVRNHPLFDSTLEQGLDVGTTDEWTRIVKTTFGLQF